MDINRVLQIDADSYRQPFLTIGYVAHVEWDRERQPNWEPDLEQDLYVLTHALATIILQMENQGERKPGEAISYAINNLLAIYVDASIEITRDKLDKERKTNSLGRRLDGF